MFIVFGAINPFPRRKSAPRKKSLTKTFSGLKSLDSSLPNAPKNIQTLDKSWKDHRNNKRNRRGCHNYGPCGLKLPGSTPATEVNMINFSTGKNGNCNRQSKQENKDLSQVICYNYNKIEHFANQ